MRRNLLAIGLGICLLAAAVSAAWGQEGAVQEERSPAEELLIQGDEAFRARNYAQAGEIYKLVVQTAQKEDQKEIQAEALAQVARSYLIQSKKEEGRLWLERAREMVSPEMPLAWSRYLGVYGRFQWRDEALEEATATFKQMYDYCLQQGLHDRAVDAAHMVAITAPHEEQIVWGQKGIEAAEQGNIQEWLGPLWNNLGWTYEEMGQYEKSLGALLKAREYHWKLGSEHNKLVADWSVGHLYRKLERWDEAENWMRPVLAWSDRRYATDPGSDAAEWVGHSCRELGEIALARDQPAEALGYLRRAEAKLSEAGMSEWDPEDYQKLSEQVEEIAQQVPEEKLRNTIVHFEIPFDDDERAVSFYKDLFGWEIVGIPELDYWMVNTVPVDERGQPVEPGVNGGMMKREVPGQLTILYVAVESVDRSVEKAGSLGGTIVVPKMAVPQMGWFAHIADTEGNVIGVFEEDPGAE